MNTKQTLEELVRYYDNTRGVGHTQTALQGISLSRGAIVIAHDMGYANYLKRSAGVDAFSINDLNPLWGANKPLVIDNAALRTIFSNSASEIRRLESNIMDLMLHSKNIEYQLQNTITENIKLKAKLDGIKKASKTISDIVA